MFLSVFFYAILYLVAAVAVAIEFVVLLFSLWLWCCCCCCCCGCGAIHLTPVCYFSKCLWKMETDKFCLTDGSSETLAHKRRLAPTPTHAHTTTCTQPHAHTHISTCTHTHLCTHSQIPHSCLLSSFTVLLLPLSLCQSWRPLQSLFVSYFFSSVSHCAALLFSNTLILDSAGICSLSSLGYQVNLVI